MSPLEISQAILIGCIAAAFVAGVVTRNVSHVDRLWSVLPPVYALVWMTGVVDNTRYVLAAVLVMIWGIRLTAIFAAKGGYAFSFAKKGFYAEDYRWDVLRKKIPGRLAFELFNLFFISGFQLTLVYAFTLPLYYLGQTSAPLGPTDYVLLSIMAALLALEAIADFQQLDYYRLRAHPEHANDARVQLGFNTYGLWRFSRHPNYVCELGQWIVLYLLLYNARGAHHPSGLGAVVLVLLFVGSTRLAESITGSKYPAYARWQRATPAWLPWDLYLTRLRARREFWADLRKASAASGG